MKSFRNLAFMLVVAACSGLPSAPVAPMLEFTHDTTEAQVWLFSDPATPYLTKLRDDYALANVVERATSDFDRVRGISRWVRHRWEHNGENVAVPGDPISILEQAAAGKRFRCVEYSIVLAGALQSLGIPARVVGLKTADVETRESGAGHVVTEAYLADLRKWAMVDGQWDAIPMLHGKPLNAVELQRALATRNPALTVESISQTDSRAYFAWVTPYLYYFDAMLDQRVGVTPVAGALMLVPVGAKNPTVFQRRFSLGKMAYTNNAAAFYSVP
jgi:transglutaminase-like putative cysteine protease